MIFCKKSIVLLLLAVGFAFTANNTIAANSVQKVKKVKQNFINGIALYEPAVQNFTEYAFQINDQPGLGIAKQPDAGTVKSINGLVIGRSSPANVIAAYNASDILPKNGIVVEYWNYGSAIALTEAFSVSNSSRLAEITYQQATQSSISNSSCDLTMALMETSNVRNSRYDLAVSLSEVSNVSNSSYDSAMALMKATNVSNSSHDSVMVLKEASSVSNSSRSAEIAYQQATQSSIAAYRNSGVFSLDNVAYRMAFDQENSLVQPATETRSYIGSGIDTAVFGLDLARPQICFYSLADRCISYANVVEYTASDCIFGSCRVLPVDSVKNSTVGLVDSVSGVAYGDAFNASISYLNFISRLDNKCQQPITDKKAVLRSFYGISELDMIGMTRNDDSSWLSIPEQCRFRALQKIQNGGDPSEEFMTAWLWQQREEDLALALETNRYVIAIQGIVDMKTVSYESDIVIGFETALNKVEIGAASIKLDDGKTAFDDESIENIIRLIKQKQLMADVVKAKAYSKNAGTTFTFKIIRLN